VLSAPPADATEEDLRSYSERYAGTQFGHATDDEAAARPPSRLTKRRLIWGVALLALVAVLGATMFAGSGQLKQVLTPTPPKPTLPPPLPPVETLEPGFTVMGKGVAVDCGTGDCLVVKVDDISFVSRFLDPAKVLDDLPTNSAHVFMAVHVAYKATAPRAAYDPLDWGVYVNDTLDQDHASVTHGPRPLLSAGRLGSGKSASGWMVYEVPMTGRITISYEPEFGLSVFKVVLRPA
jgi:hypothetical protein